MNSDTKYTKISAHELRWRGRFALLRRRRINEGGNSNHLGTRLNLNEKALHDCTRIERQLRKSNLYRSGADRSNRRWINSRRGHFQRYLEENSNIGNRAPLLKTNVGTIIQIVKTKGEKAYFVSSQCLLFHELL